MQPSKSLCAALLIPGDSHWDSRGNRRKSQCGCWLPLAVGDCTRQANLRSRSVLGVLGLKRSRAKLPRGHHARQHGFLIKRARQAHISIMTAPSVGIDLVDGQDRHGWPDKQVTEEDSVCSKRAGQVHEISICTADTARCWQSSGTCDRKARGPRAEADPERCVVG